MKVRSFASIASLTLAAAALVACPGGDKKPSGATTAMPAPATSGNAAATANAAATGSATTKPASTGGAAASYGKGTIKGVVSFTGTPIEMKVPKKRKEADLCKDKEIKYNAVVVNDGKLQDVFVAIADGQLEGEYSVETTAQVDQKDCMYAPRIQGVMPEQMIQIKNSDATTHNVNASLGSEVQFNKAQPKGSPNLDQSFDEPGIYRMKCDVHPWMRSFVIASDNPFHAVSGADGSFSIGKVPDGKYKVIAWHSQYGPKEMTIEVKDGAAAEANFSYDGTEKEPAENAGELKDLF
jgi:plastocyanin